MKRRRWHILRDGDALTVARQVPVRFDVVVVVDFPVAGCGVNALRLAQQVRQDMWRAVQDVRGFSPVVRIDSPGGVLRISAGGRVAGRVPGNLAAKITAVLEDEGKGSRWRRHARRSDGAQ